MGWIFGAMFTTAFLILGFPQVKALVIERGPTSLSCREFLERGSHARWVALSACDLDWTRAREFQGTRYRKAVLVPVVGRHRQMRQQLYIRVAPDDAEQSRRDWRGMLDTPSTDVVPDFAQGGNVHILYTSRPGVAEPLLAVAPALLFVTLAIRAGRRARGRAADLRRLRTRFPSGSGTGRVVSVDLGGVVRAWRLALTVAAIAGVPLLAASIVVAARGAASGWSIAALAAAGAVVTGASLMGVLRAAHRLPWKRTRHASASRRPFRVVAYRAAAGLVVVLGLMIRVVTGSSIMMWITMAGAILLWNRGTRHATHDARTVMERDPRPPVLLLRSFSDDDLEAKGATMPWSHSQPLAFVAARRLQVLGPVVAVAAPDEGLPPLGPYRVFVQKQDWRAEVDTLIAQSRAVVLFLGYSEGLLWEFRRLIDAERAVDLTLVVPPAEPASLERRWSTLIELTQHHPAWSGVRELDPLSTLLIRALPGERLLAYRGTHTNAAYDWAFQLCAARR